jgi:uncharacterized Ntn-hydrolase superfamily protein
MERSTVWAAMAAAFGGSEGDLVDRLLDALDAAESEGGDARGRQSAAILVLPAGTGIRASTSWSRIRRNRYRSCDGS